MQNCDEHRHVITQGGRGVALRLNQLGGEKKDRKEGLALRKCRILVVGSGAGLRERE